MERELSEEEKLEAWKENWRREDAIRRQFAAMVEECLADPTGLTMDLEDTKPIEYTYTEDDLARDKIRMKIRELRRHQLEREERE